jgi:hypothetical protein
MQHRDLSPELAAEQHVTDALAQHPVTPQVTSIAARRVLNGLGEDERGLRERQVELQELGEERAVACVEGALEELRNAQLAMRRGS